MYLSQFILKLRLYNILGQISQVFLRLRHNLKSRNTTSITLILRIHHTWSAIEASSERSNKLNLLLLQVARNVQWEKFLKNLNPSPPPPSRPSKKKPQKKFPTVSNPVCNASQGRGFARNSSDSCFPGEFDKYPCPIMSKVQDYRIISNFM